MSVPSVTMTAKPSVAYFILDTFEFEECEIIPALAGKQTNKPHKGAYRVSTTNKMTPFSPACRSTSIFVLILPNTEDRQDHGGCDKRWNYGPMRNGRCSTAL
jgi:hypothetical protein